MPEGAHFIPRSELTLCVCVLQVEVGWQERAPRSLSKDYVEPGATVEAGSTATPKPPLTRPQDVFISVKTTGSYHRARLPIILKTWFQLAKDQVNKPPKLVSAITYKKDVLTIL